MQQLLATQVLRIRIREYYGGGSEIAWELEEK